MVALISMKFSMMVHIGAGQIFSLWGGAVPRGSANPKFWPFDGEYLENGKLQRYTSITA